jgi:antitoxin (DNA-binding transcriptional repressor) of toxin-antitoxin stability system
MREMDIAHFRKNCSKVLRELQNTGETLRITRNGETLVNVIPVPPKAPASGRKVRNGTYPSDEESKQD